MGLEDYKRKRNFSKTPEPSGDEARPEKKKSELFFCVQKHLASHLANTGEWLPRIDGYKTWHDSPDHGLLWIRGVPGSGKSVIAATLAHRLSQEDVPVLYFFFRQIIDANHRPMNLLRDWLDQIILYSPPLQATLKEYIDTDRSLDSVAAVNPNPSPRA